MADECCAQGNNIMILSCSGGSNVGQLANRAAVELTQEGFGKMFCLAGIGGHITGFVQSAKDVPMMVAIDGCPVGCTKAILKHADIPAENYIVITTLGIEKNKNFNLSQGDLEHVKTAVKGIVNKGIDVASNATSGCCGCSTC
jgi:uncharacterized metal-binding protein